MNASDIDFSPGTIIAGRLRVVRQLGAGGFGAVYEVEHLVTRHRRALKVLHPRHLGDPELASRFLREASAAARIGNPHIAETFDTGALENGAPWMLMELLSGESLSDVLRWKPRQDVHEACRFMRDVALAVHAAHEAGIIHRDLKPDNLFVTQREGKPLAKVLDFGMSKFSSAATGMESLTAVGVTMGTPLYMAPEQMRGARDVDGRADTYSLGVILFEMLAGGAPFDAKSFSELAAQKHSGITPRLESLRPDCPAALAHVVHRAMAVEPEQRHGTAGELAEALSPWVELPPSPRRDDADDDEIEETSVRVRPVPEGSSTSAPKLVRVAATPPVRAPEPTAAPKGPPDKPTSPAMPAWVKPSSGARTLGLSDWSLLASVAVLLVVASAVALTAFRPGPPQARSFQLEPASAPRPPEKPTPKTGPDIGAFDVEGGGEVPIRPPTGAGTAQTPPPPQPLNIRIESDQLGASVELAGARVGQTPFDARVDKVKLPVALRLSADGYESAEATLTDMTGATLSLSLKKKVPANGGRGTLRFVVKPWAEVECREAGIKDTTPFQDKLVPVGEYSCTFTNPEFPTQIKLVRVEANTTVKVELNFLQ